MTYTAEVFHHDVEAATAVIQVTNNGVVHTDTYDLKMVYPGTVQVLEMLNLKLDEAAQQRAIDYVIRQVALQMTGDSFPGDPTGTPVVEQEAPEPAPENTEAYVQVEPEPPVAPHESLVPMEMPPEPVVEEEV